MINLTNQYTEGELKSIISDNVLLYNEWHLISRYHKLSEDFIREFKDKVDWYYIGICQKLSEGFIKEFKDRVNWYCISAHQKLSQDFIREFEGFVDWDDISKYQHLSEDFIREFKDYVNWYYVSIHQKLSESFIKEFKDKVNWFNISIHQKLSESFIKEFKNKINWSNISKYQKLSEGFFKEFKDKVDWYYIYIYQELSKDFIKELNLEISYNNWLYVDPDEKLKAVKDSGLYEIEGDYVIAYKGIRSDRYSKFNFQYQYFVGETYTCHADFNNESKNSFGLSAWTFKEARDYCNQLIIKVKIHKDDLAALVHDRHKLRCSKFTVLEDIERN